jgi:quercetin dioxygenase-like cupin family protein
MKRALILLAACGSSKPAPTTTMTAQPPPTHPAPPLADAPGPSQDEILAAIQKAMTDLDAPAHACWAAAATERFDVEGELELRVDVGQGSAQVTIAKDASNSKRLGTCMTALLGGYKFAPPLVGQSFQLPFKFTAPDGQSVIDRRLVDSHAQGNVAVSVLLDENNTGNGHASMFEIAIQNGGSTGMRLADRAELWYFLGAAKMKQANRHCTSKKAPAVPDGGTPGVMTACGGGTIVAPIAAGDMVYVPKGAAREAVADGADVHAVVVAVPGGREGAARAGALPTPTADSSTAPLVVLKADKAKTFGPATIYLDDSIQKGTPLAASILKLPAGAKVPEHVHANETEMLYVLEGAGTMTVAGTDVPVTSTSVVQIPPNTKHAFAGTDAVRALQIYTPAGPEQRFKKK